MKKLSIPVFMYHTIGIPNSAWQWSELTMHYTIFEKQIVYLKNKGYRTVHLNELYEYIFNGKQLHPKTIILTFDDGYADNYVYAYPILKKYDFKGTIFVNPQFVDKKSYKRLKYNDPTYEANYDTSGFLTWDEMREMESDGTIDIQSHALTHTWYPVSNKIIDFRHPGDKYIWMTWNDNIDEKPYLQFDNNNTIKWGKAVYAHEKSLMARRYFPDTNLDDFLMEYVNNNGGECFFYKDNWEEELFSRVELYKQTHKITDSFESENERLERIRFELEESKLQIEKNLNKTIDFLCWPGGSGTIEGQRIAKEVGYKMTTAARDIPPVIRKKLQNNGLDLKDRIARTSPILIQKKYKNSIEPIYCNGFGLWLRIMAFKSAGIKKKIYKIAIQMYGRIRMILYK